MAHATAPWVAFTFALILSADAALLRDQKYFASKRGFRNACLTRQHRSFTQGKQLPGAGMDPASLKPYTVVHKDGYTYTGCMRDQLFEKGDKHGNGKFSYKLEDVSNVSIIHYKETVPKEDRKDMTPDVCFNFCRTIPSMVFFGLINGRDCYCEPFHHRIAGDSSSCDAVCEGAHGKMCGGMKKSSIFEMHMCSDTVKELSSSRGRAFVTANWGERTGSSLITLANGMQKQAEKYQSSFGKVGDLVVSDLMQATKVWAGKLVHAGENASKFAKSLQGYVADADSMKRIDISDFGAVTSAEKLIKRMDTDGAVTKKTTQHAWDLMKLANRGLGGWGRDVQYYPIMYFVDKAHLNTPTTCGGVWDEKTIYGVSPDECASACDRQTVKPECVGFSFYEGGLCFLFSKFKSVTYYTKCDVESSKPESVPEPPVIDFKDGTKIEDNLKGEKEGTKEARFTNVGEYDGKALDIVITSEGDPVTADLDLETWFGNINLLPGAKADLKFTFQDHKTKSPVVLPEFTMAFFDLDVDKWSFLGERTIIGGFEDYIAAPDYEFIITKQEDGRTLFEAVEAGGLCDNPTDPMELGLGCQDRNQRTRAFSVRFKNKASFSVTLDAHCFGKGGQCKTNKKKKGKGGKGGRNWLFHPRSALDPKTRTAKSIQDPSAKILIDDSITKGTEGTTRCYAKLEDFEGTSLRPDRSGKCELCLKEATQADRCFK